MSTFLQKLMATEPKIIKLNNNNEMRIWSKKKITFTRLDDFKDLKTKIKFFNFNFWPSFTKSTQENYIYSNSFTDSSSKSPFTRFIEIKNNNTYLNVIDLETSFDLNKFICKLSNNSTSMIYDKYSGTLRIIGHSFIECILQIYYLFISIENNKNWFSWITNSFSTKMKSYTQLFENDETLKKSYEKYLNYKTKTYTNTNTNTNTTINESNTDTDTYIIRIRRFFEIIIFISNFVQKYHQITPIMKTYSIIFSPPSQQNITSSSSSNSNNNTHDIFIQPQSEYPITTTSPSYSYEEEEESEKGENENESENESEKGENESEKGESESESENEKGENESEKGESESEKGEKGENENKLRY